VASFLLADVFLGKAGDGLEPGLEAGQRYGFVWVLFLSLVAAPWLSWLAQVNLTVSFDVLVRPWIFGVFEGLCHKLTP
jgi:hypothetical protein